MERNKMSHEDDNEITYELECSECGAEYEIVNINSGKNEPIYCPFCGADIDIEDIEEDNFEEEFDREYEDS